MSSSTSLSSSSSVDSFTNSPTLEMSSRSLISVSENRLTMSTISSITSLQSVATTVDLSTVPLASSLSMSSPDINESQSNIPLISTAASSLSATTSEQPSNPSVTTVTQSFGFNSPSVAKSETPLDGLSTYVTREEGNFSDSGKTLPPVSPVSDSGQQASTTFYAQENNTMSNYTGPLQGTYEMFANSANLMLKLKIPIPWVHMLCLFSSNYTC